MRTVKWLLPILLVLLAGCSSLTGEEPQQQKSAQKKELTIVMFDNPASSAKFRINVFQKHAKLFEAANPEVKVNFVLLPSEKYHDELLKRIAEKKPMDLVYGFYDSDLSHQGVYADLNLFFKAERMTTDDMYKPLVEDTTIQGKFTGIPMSPEPLVVFYNKKWFENANLPEPNENWTWEQFFTDSVHLKDANIVEGKEIYGSELPMNTTFLDTLAQSEGGSLLSPDGSKTSGYLDSTVTTRAIANLMKDINQSKVVKPISSDRNPALQELGHENVGMGVSSALNYSFLMNSKSLIGKFGVVSLPHSEKGLRANAVNISTLSIAAASKQQQLAWKFIKDVILAPDSGFQQDWAKQEMLTSKAAIQKLKLKDDPGKKVLYEALEFAVKPVGYINPKLQKVHTPNLLKALSSANSLEAVQQVLTETAFDIDKQLTQLN